MKKIKIVLVLFFCLRIMIPFDKGFAQSLNKADSVSIKSITDSVYTAIKKSVFSRSDDLFYIGIDKNSLAFNYDIIKATQEASSKFVEILNVYMNDKKIAVNENKDEALYYINYNLTFKVNPFTFQVDNVRETGVLRLRNNKWEIVQQHASVPVTNDVWPAYFAKEPPVLDPLHKFSVNELSEDFDLFTLAL
jgi:hypothetical protein